MGVVMAVALLELVLISVSSDLVGSTNFSGNGSDMHVKLMGLLHAYGTLRKLDSGSLGMLAEIGRVLVSKICILKLEGENLEGLGLV